MAELGPLESAVEFFRANDLDDLERVAQFSDDYVEFCDEISAGWGRLRGEDVRNYGESMAALVKDARTSLRDARVRELGDIATVTGVVEQQYTLNGERVNYDFLASLVLRRGEGNWRMLLGQLTPVGRT